MADPASHTAVMSWMTEELEKNKLRQEGRQGKTNQITLLPDPAERIRSCEKSRAGNKKKTHVFRGSTREIQ